MNIHVFAIVANDLFRDLYVFGFCYLFVVSFARTYFLQSFLLRLPFLYCINILAMWLTLLVKLWFLNH